MNNNRRFNRLFNKLKRSAGYLLASIRAIILIVLLAIYIFIYLTGSLIAEEEKLMKPLKKSWCKLALKVLGLKVKVNSNYFNHKELIDKSSFLAISNHRSFIDPVVTLAFLNVRPLAKAEIENYPLIGYAAKKVGVVFVERQSEDSRREAINSIKVYLNSDKSVLVYPEGTTSDSETTLKFKNGSFIAAAESHRPILPLTIHYKNPYANWTTDSMITQYFRHFSHLSSIVHLKIGNLVQLSEPESDIKSIRDDINQNIKHFKTARY